MTGRTGHACSSLTPAALNASTYVALECGPLAADNAEGIPKDCLLGLAQLELSNVVSVSSISWYIADDSTGNSVRTPVKTLDIVAGEFGLASIADDLARHPFSFSSRNTFQKLWVFAKLNSGATSASAVARISFERPE